MLARRARSPVREAIARQTERSGRSRSPRELVRADRRESVHSETGRKSTSGWSGRCRRLQQRRESRTAPRPASAVEALSSSLPGKHHVLSTGRHACESELDRSERCKDSWKNKQVISAEDLEARLHEEPSSRSRR